VYIINQIDLVAMQRIENIGSGNACFVSPPLIELFGFDDDSRKEPVLRVYELVLVVFGSFVVMS
jgi:hypothetical protein